MKLHLAWPVSVATAALVLAGCSSSDSGSTEESSASSSAPRHRRRRPPPRARELREGGRPTTRGTPSARSTSSSSVVKVFTDAVRAGNLKAAQDAFAPSRMPWERIEPIAGLVEEIDGKVDSRVDDFAGVDDPAFTGWHRLEYLLFEKNTTEGGAPFADQLDKDIATLKEQFADGRGHADRRGERRGRAHRRGLRGQDHRRGGSLLQDRPVGLRRQPAGLAGRDRQAESGAEGGRSRAARQDRRRILRRSSTPCGRCARATAGCTSARRTASSRRRGAPRSR